MQAQTKSAPENRSALPYGIHPTAFLVVRLLFAGFWFGCRWWRWRSCVFRLIMLHLLFLLQLLLLLVVLLFHLL